MGTSPKESAGGAPDQMTVSQHSKSEGWQWHPSPLSLPPSSLFCNLCIKKLYLRHKHRLNMEVDLQSLFGSMSRDVHSCTYWLRPRDSPPPPAFGLVLLYESAIGQQR
jgi:hypothetical protein